MKNKIINPRECNFKDYPNFKPNLTPKQIIRIGSFGGTYFKEADRISPEDFPKSWFTGLPISNYKNDNYDINVNKYKVKVGMDTKGWEDAGWIKTDKAGWLHWYANFYLGRRLGKEDDWQINRWKNIASEKSGRFRLQFYSMLYKSKKDINDETVSPKLRQILIHWAYYPTLSDYNEFKKMKNLK